MDNFYFDDDDFLDYSSYIDNFDNFDNYIDIDQKVNNYTSNNNNKMNENKVVIREIVVNEGRTRKRCLPRSRGTVHPILKRSSHIRVIVEETK